MVLLKNLRDTTLSLLDGPMYPREYRPYLGMSELGHSCARYLWYSFRWAFQEEISSRMMRLFKRGHREEPAIIAELEKIGYKVTNPQIEMVAGFGHIKGHWDGQVENVVEAPKTPHVLEIKTMNDKSFREIVKSGVKSSKPQYFGQCQMYMKYGQRKRTLFIAVNKNDDAYYIERLYYDRDLAWKLVKRGEGVVLAEVPPPRPYSKSWYECRWCGAREICHYGKPLSINCRTCTSAEPQREGRWGCTTHEIGLTHGMQLKGCDLYTVIDHG